MRRTEHFSQTSVFTNRRLVTALAWVVTVAIIALHAELLVLIFRDFGRYQRLASTSALAMAHLRLRFTSLRSPSKENQARIRRILWES